jgi:hypothetical protein
MGTACFATNLQGFWRIMTRPVALGITMIASGEFGMRERAAFAAGLSTPAFAGRAALLGGLLLLIRP